MKKIVIVVVVGAVLGVGGWFAIKHLQPSQAASAQASAASLLGQAQDAAQRAAAATTQASAKAQAAIAEHTQGLQQQISNVRQTMNQNAQTGARTTTEVQGKVQQQAEIQTNAAISYRNAASQMGAEGGTVNKLADLMDSQAKAAKQNAEMLGSVANVMEHK